MILLAFTLIAFLKLNSGRIKGLDLTHDIAIVDYDSSGSTVDGSFSRVARLDSMGGCARYEYVPVFHVSDEYVDLNEAGANALPSQKLHICSYLKENNSSDASAVPSGPKANVNQEKTPTMSLTRTS